MFSHCIIAVATEGWVEQRNPLSGRVWYENPETGEVSNERPGADCVEPYLQRAGLRMASVRGLAQASRAALRLSRGSAAMNPLASPPPRGSGLAQPPGQPPDHAATFEVEAVAAAGQLPTPPARPSAMPQRGGIPGRETGGGLNPLAAGAAPAPRMADALAPTKPGSADPGAVTIGRNAFLAAASMCVLSLLLSISLMVVVRHGPAAPNYRAAV